MKGSRQDNNMVTRSFVAALACFSCFLVIQALLPLTIAVRVSPNVDEFMIENKRTRSRTRQNYVVQRALDDELSANIDNIQPVPVADAFEPETNPEEFTAQFLDYANMIRNNKFFLDNSVETTTRKRGNIKKKNHAIPELPCNCESEKDPLNLGDNYFPSKVESRKCIEGTCPPPYRCKASYYYITVLKKESRFHREESMVALPTDFHSRWSAHLMNVTTACVCSSDVDGLK